MSPIFSLKIFQNFLFETKKKKMNAVAEVKGRRGVQQKKNEKQNEYKRIGREKKLADDSRCYGNILDLVKRKKVTNWTQTRLVVEGKLGEGLRGIAYKVKHRNTMKCLKLLPLSWTSRNKEALEDLVALRSLKTIKKETPNYLTFFDSFVLTNLPASTQDKLNQLDPQCPATHYLGLLVELGSNSLDNTMLTTAVEGLSIVKQLVLSLVIAKRRLDTNHNDVHPGNVLVKRSASPKTLKYTLDGKVIRIPSHGLVVGIIDFSEASFGRANGNSDVGFLSFITEEISKTLSKAENRTFQTAIDGLTDARSITAIYPNASIFKKH
ncbi:Protein kinase domain-containing protein [Caenorhabditis elegans]|uniref:Protein kinase domain-containing protein n=2 Tax=Caenorhabditis elegans TaxID=6239 RepID=C1P643_CAEEL|nr:Protein kinase domain-containing protein [Caenorhabditis elegans]CAX65046.1 Protein kinase domain-containing protein [Caenorhabditis elegans]|eukprot:NP_001255462.1 Uncharacterized protein CELE_C04G2.10 [Caenorhabditis elegans]